MELSRKDLITELKIKMGLREGIKCVRLYDLKNNNELKAYIKEMIPNIKRFYNWYEWDYFLLKENKRNEIELLKLIFKFENYKIFLKKLTVPKNGIKKQYNYLFFIKNID